MNPQSNGTNRTQKWLKEITNSEKHLLIIAIILGILTLSLIIALSVVLHKTVHDDNDDICMTPGCVDAAAKALSYMDTSIDPCDDFYEFACGKFIKTALIPEDKTRVNTFNDMNDRITEQLRDIISNDINENSTKPEKLIKKYYDVCMNTTAIELEGLKTVKDIIKQMGGWPVLEGANWNEVNFDWQTIAYKQRKLGIGPYFFFGVGIGIDIKNSSRYTIVLSEGRPGFTREYLLEGLSNKLVKAYYEYVVDIAVIFGAKKTSAEQELKEVLEFQIEMAKIILPREETRNATALYNPMTIAEIQSQFPYVNWLEYIRNVLDIPDIEIKNDEVVIVVVPKYFYQLETLLRNTPKRTLSNFIMARSVLGFVSYLNEEVRDRTTKYHKVLLGISQRTARWKECTYFATGRLYLPSGALYAKKYFDIDAKHHVEEMVSGILTEFKHILQTVDWMDEHTRKNALEKADAILPYIAYPEELLEDKKVEKFYASLDDSSKSYLMVIRDFSLFMSDYYLKKLREQVNKTDWVDHAIPAVVNAFYSSTQNSIQFPAGILQGVFYSDSRPRYMNYGGIGYILGHEITHGFDDQGRQFDKEGNLNDWWGEETTNHFLKKTECIIHQYGNYTLPDIDKNLNGINTQGENIADNGGILEAYVAYANWVKRNGPEKRLPGLPYTAQQMFWVSAAQIWCDKTRKEALLQQVTTGSHSPSQYRVLVPFANTGYFGNDFNCPLGSTMNPIDKCKVW